MSSASPSSLHELFAPYEPVCEIGSPPRPLYVVRQATPGGGRAKLLVAERFAGCATSSDARAAAFVGEARRISTLASPNVARVRELAVRGDDMIVFWDFIHGEKIVHTWLSGGMPLEVALRLILDVLAGVGAIHGLRDAKQQPMQLAHGEVSTATVVIGLDGVARVLHAIARRLPGALPEDASLAYVAPEVHAGGPYDARADVFSVGVLLWEALAGKRLFSDAGGTSAGASQRDQAADVATIVARMRAGIAPAMVPDKTAWARALVAVAAKAVAASPDDRWQTAAAMAGEIRRVAGLKLAPAAAAVAFVKGAVGQRVDARRERFESGAPVLPLGPSALTSGAPAEAWPKPAAAPAAPAAARSEPDAAPAAPSAARSKPDPSPHGQHVPHVSAAAPSSPGARLWSDDEGPLAAAPVLAAPAQVPPAVPEPDIELVPESLPPPPQSPPALPTRALQPPSSTSYFAAAIDVPISIAPPPVDLLEVSPTSVEQANAIKDEARASRRRIVAVLGGVGMLGMIVFALAGWRVAHRPVDAVSSGLDHAAPAPVVTSRPAVPPTLAHAPSGLDHAAAGAANAPPSLPTIVATAAVPLGSTRSAPPSPPASPAPRAKPSPVAPPTPKTPARSPLRSKPAPNSNFDPNSL